MWERKSPSQMAQRLPKLYPMSLLAQSLANEIMQSFFPCENASELDNVPLSAQLHTMSGPDSTVIVWNSYVKMPLLRIHGKKNCW